jgi:hypothetical protein
VTLYLPSDAKANLRAESRGSGGDIENEFNRSGDDGHSVDVPINGGGPQVYLKASYGRVQVRKNTY